MKTNKIYAVTSAMSLGCTFLDWSILWLSGQKQIFSAKTSTWRDIVDDPLCFSEGSNAHRHPKNHRSGWEENKKLIQDIGQIENKGTISLYPFPLSVDKCCNHLGVDIQDLENRESWQKVIRYLEQDYKDMLDWLAVRCQIPVIYIAPDPNIKGYLWTIRSLNRKMTSPTKPKNKDELLQEFNDVFFHSSQNRWKNLGLTDIWDIRERMALDIRPFALEWDLNFYPEHDHLWINCQDLWFNTEKIIHEIMAWLDIDIVESRLDHWLPIMRRWQQIHNDSQKFPRYLPKILWSIVNGYPYNISDLTFFQEVIIQHCLIYQHDLNLKTHNLDKFPDCASDLHALLEPDFHKLSDY